MTLTIWKYQIPTEDHFQINLPIGAKILTIDTQYNNPQMWVLLNPKNETTPRYFRLAGTGHPIEENSEDLEYIATCQLLGGDLVFHLFEIKKEILQIESSN